MELPIAIKGPIQTTNRYFPDPTPTIFVLNALYFAGFKKVGAAVAGFVITNLRTLVGVATTSWFGPGAQIVIHPGAVASSTIYAASAASAGHVASSSVPKIADTDPVDTTTGAEF